MMNDTNQIIKEESLQDENKLTEKDLKELTNISSQKSSVSGSTPEL